MATKTISVALEGLSLAQAECYPPVPSACYRAGTVPCAGLVASNPRGSGGW